MTLHDDLVAGAAGVAEQADDVDRTHAGEARRADAIAAAIRAARDAVMVGIMVA